jgi:hypothetical protein
MANIFTQIEDMITLFETFVHGNVTGVSGTPVVKGPEDENTGTLSPRETNGLIEILNSELVRYENESFGHRDEVYQSDVNVWFTGDIWDYYEEIDRIINANNESASRTYDYELLPVYSGKRGQGVKLIELIVTQTKINVVKNT